MDGHYTNLGLCWHAYNNILSIKKTLNILFRGMIVLHISDLFALDKNIVLCWAWACLSWACWALGLQFTLLTLPCKSSQLQT